MQDMNLNIPDVPAEKLTLVHRDPSDFHEISEEHILLERCGVKDASQQRRHGGDFYDRGNYSVCGVCSDCIGQNL